MAGKQQTARGDFQTPDDLAREVTRYLGRLYPAPGVVVEPTCGRGAFLRAGVDQWGSGPAYCGFDINPAYIDQLKADFADNDRVSLESADFFGFDWPGFLQRQPGPVLVLGNPPWVTNAALGALGSRNLPVKRNFQHLQGLEAKTGKANFDIAVWMLIRLIEGLGQAAARVAMLCKTATARKVLTHLWTTEAPVGDAVLHTIDATRHFGVAASACLLVVGTDPAGQGARADVYEGLSTEKQIGRIGFHGNELVADIEAFEKSRAIDGQTPRRWRSGVKHDAVKVMELRDEGGVLRNGYGAPVDIEPAYLYPLLKSSDLANNRLVPRRLLIVTQQHPSDDTAEISTNAPRTWAYLDRHGAVLDARKSAVYAKRPRFSMFGIGDYSFSKWKVAVSGFYKTVCFRAIGPLGGRPVLLDDTCYFLPCGSKGEAAFIAAQLNSRTAQLFLKSLAFFDAKRPIKMDILRRIDLKKLAGLNGEEKKATRYFSAE
jgi:hypothetical protein